jgi:hypothetical protein
MNTRVIYLYRDAANYKATESVVLAGTLSADEARRRRAAIDTAARGAGIDPGGFSPVDFGLPPAQLVLWSHHDQNEDDHIYNELLDLEPTDAPITHDTIDARGLLAAAERAATRGYDLARAMRTLGLDA